MTSTSNDPRLDHEAYREARATWLGVRDDQQKFIDQTILTLGGGGLGLSITFLRTLASPQSNFWLLHVGELFLVVSIVLMVTSLHLSQHALSMYLKSLDESAVRNFEPTSSDFRGKYVNRWARITQYCNWLASTLLLIGIFTLTVFAYLNESATLFSSISSSSRKPQMEKIVTIPNDGTGVQRGRIPAAPAVALRPPSPAPQPPPPAPKP